MIKDVLGVFIGVFLLVSFYYLMSQFVLYVVLDINSCANIIEREKLIYFDDIDSKNKFYKRYNECLIINDIKND